MTPSTGRRARLAVIGLGNTLAGDDGAGVVVVERLRARWSACEGLFLGTLEGDLLAIHDLLERADRFVFVDAVAGERPGELSIAGETRRAFGPSLHQLDIAAVMHTLEGLEVTEPFPPWEVWGVVIEPPSEVGEGLSAVVAAGVSELTERLSQLIEEVLGRRPP